MITRLSAGPWRSLVAGVIYMGAVIVLATCAYSLAGWSVGDALYFVVITIFTVGYEEVHPILTPGMRALTMATIVLGSTGVIFLTGALVQAFTYLQIQQLFGAKRMKTQIAKMSGHVIICGYGRIGAALAAELRAGGIQFVIVDPDESRLAEAVAEGFCTWTGDATNETTLIEVGVERAQALATVVPNDAVNVFITLTARSLNKDLEIIARGVSANTKGKLLHAGASSVVEPTHIGAERIAQLILFPRTARITEGTQRLRAMAAGLHGLGLELEVEAVPPESPMAGRSIGEAERIAGGTVFIVAINRKSGETLTRPDQATVIEPGDGVVMITRASRAAAKRD
jgi:Trk K+ transport system NAD-binding subunit